MAAAEAKNVTDTFPCVLIGVGLRKPPSMLSDKEKAYLAQYRPTSPTGGNVWQYGVRYSLAANKGFKISALQAPDKPVSALDVAPPSGMLQEGGNGGGGGDGENSFFLDMLGTRTETTYWRIEPAHPEYLLLEGEAAPLRSQTTSRTSGSANVRAALENETDPGLAIYFADATAAQQFLYDPENNKYLHQIFHEIRMIAVFVHTN